MSRDRPTPEELDAILQDWHGAYGVNLPAWYGLYLPPIPEEASEALGKAIDARARRTGS